jgi:exodeoxyribonuclease VII large subunit
MTTRIPLETTPTATPGSPSNLAVWTVGELSQKLKRTVEDAFGLVRVRGEVSGFKRHSSGHLYLKLKDPDAVLDAVCWRGIAAKLGLALEDGMEVICTGRLTTYPGRSQYQLVVERVELAGPGALMALLEQRKRKLMAEGLFAAERKRALPYLPEVIGVITSPTGAVIRDILHRLRDRFPRRVLLWPVAVQGDGAAAQIAQAIAGFNRLAPGGSPPRPDVLIVARGGGSLEDLWAFNEEIVVRAAAGSVIPLISAVGHETDTTLIDFVADRRAPTPSAAAEMAVPVRLDLAADVAEFGRRQLAAWHRLVVERRDRLKGLVRGLRGPRELLAQVAQRCDDLAERLDRVLVAQVAERRAALAALAGLLRPTLFRREIAEQSRRVNEMADRLGREFRRRLDDLGSKLAALAKLLDSLSYRAVLERGYAVVRTVDGTPILAAAAALPGLDVEIEFRDGHRRAAIADSHDSAAKPKPKRKSDKGVGQGELL